MTIGEKLECFEQTMERTGHGEAPNGAAYLITICPETGRPIVTRTYCGSSDNVVGFNGMTFDSVGMARRWAVVDGRYAMGHSVTSLSQRRKLC